MSAIEVKTERKTTTRFNGGDHVIVAVDTNGAKTFHFFGHHWDVNEFKKVADLFSKAEQWLFEQEFKEEQAANAALETETSK